MDKRTILYVILVSVVFFGLNLYFGKQRATQEERLKANRMTKAAESQSLLAKELETRTASPSDLPLVQLNDQQHGLLLPGALITIAEVLPMPSSFSVKGKTYLLKTDKGIIGAPALYINDEFKGLSLPDLTESQDVQLVSFEGDGVTVTLGQYFDSGIKVLGPTPKANALVLSKEGTNWLVAGLYEKHGRIFVPLQNLPVLAPHVQLTTTAVNFDKTQKFYVLQNETVQLVFSNVGGALSEINLPLSSKTNHQSVVNEIGPDREMIEDSPVNARFPLFPYYLPGSDQQHSPQGMGGYYPLIRRTLETGKGLSPISPEYYALNVVSDYPEMAELVYQVEKFTDDTIVFVGSQPHRKITKTYRLTDQIPYYFELTVKVDGDSRGLFINSGIPEVEIMSNSSSPSVQYRVFRKGKSEMENLSLPKAKESISSGTISPEWIVNSNGYLGVILDPTTEIGTGYRVMNIPGNLAPTRLSLINKKEYPVSKYPGYETLLPLPQKGGTSRFRVYAGPFEEKTLKSVDKALLKESGENPHYANARTFYGWFSFISKPFARLLFVVMQFFYMLTHSWGVAIILLTVFLRICLYPLNAWSIKSMRRMQLLAPQVQAIQKKYKKEPKKSQMEIMTLYREKKVNPFMGCVPILIQLPFLIAMFDLLKSSFQLRGAVFIPGWIDNLTAPDQLFCWNYSIFFFGNCFHLLPFLLGGVMFVQQRMTAGKQTSVGEMTDQQRQQKAMGTIMTVVFTVMFYNFPSGLNLYWLSSMSLGILQQWFTNKMLDKKQQKPEVITPTRKK